MENHTNNGRQAYDVFNGDADGICALHQMRLAFPREAELITGAKRDIALLKRVPIGKAAQISVFDISLDTNVDALRALLDDGCDIEYFDHHAALQTFPHPHLQLHWDESPQVCSSLLVDKHLQGRFRTWAIAAAFGDNLELVASKLADEMGLTAQQAQTLQTLGTVLNYNAYGETVTDLHFAPDALYRAVHRYVDPFEFVANAAEYKTLHEGYQTDAQKMQDLRPHWNAPSGAVFVLPHEAWARRISGIFANQLVAAADGRSFAIMTEQSNGDYVVSVRSGKPETHPAHRFCETFETGGGRKGAGGVNRLPAADVEHFAAKFFAYYGPSSAPHFG